MRIALTTFVVLIALTACGGGDGAQDLTNVTFYKYNGSKQCAGGGLSLAAMERQLADAGVQVRSASCGADGKVYPAVCGADDGRIGIFEIPAEQAPAASGAGFAPLNNLPSAVKLACP